VGEAGEGVAGETRQGEAGEGEGAASTGASTGTSYAHAHVACRCRAECRGAGVAGCRVQGAGCRVQGAGCKVQSAECRVQGLARVQGAGQNCSPVSSPSSRKLSTQRLRESPRAGREDSNSQISEHW
jgi:hypothetical protein